MASADPSWANAAPTASWALVAPSSSSFIRERAIFGGSVAACAKEGVLNLISHRFVRVLWLIVAWAYLLLVLAADLVVWPGSNISILYALPILIAAVYESPLYVNVVGTLTLVLA
ncbi:MAG TPA: hypothetical protein VKX96_02510, partial [Chloroflexota bacterium]|nr:hypothetical protein [Chloroflexota bacterium]